MHHLKTNPLRLLIVGIITTFMVSACSDDSREETKKKIKGDRISVLSYERSLRADPRLSGVPIVLPQPYENDSWHQPGAFADNVAHHLMINDETRKKFSVSFVNGSTNDLKMTATPVIAEDMIFGLGADMRLTAANAHTGKKIWTIKVYLKGAEIEDGFGGGISYWGGQIFVATGFGELLAVDAKTGRINWRET
ncbi:MAG: PQQ-binding-like beta-propeller repeat protein, partial [Pseudomonadota bacterium]|nr:PQQ-binding-like beta-propeller repeat protein [Pseudomonadota bacterium]